MIRHPLVRCLALIAVLVCGALGIDDARAAYQPGAVVQVPNVAAITGAVAGWNGTNQLQVSGYLNTGDGGEGTFVLGAPGCTADGGYILKDTTNNCFYRTNLNGDLRQYGVVLGSNYDCSPTPSDPVNPGTGVGLASCLDSQPVLAAMLSAGGHSNITKFIDPVQSLICNNLILPPYSTFSTGAEPESFASQSLRNITGTLWTCDHKNIQLGGNNTVRQLIELPKWIGINYPNGAYTIADNYTIVQTMATKGDTGILCANQNCVLQEDLMGGYDTGYEAQKANNRLNTVNVDANVGFYAHNAGADMHWYDPEVNSLVTNSASADPTCSAMTNPRGTCNIIAVGWNPQQVIESPTNPGECEVIIDSWGNSSTNPWNGNGNLQTNFYIWLSGLDHTTGGAIASRRWKLTRIDDTHVDLQGSQCTTDTVGGTTYLDGPTASVSWTAGSNLLVGVTNFTNIASEMGISGVAHASLTGIPNGTYIQALGKTSGIIVMSATATASGSGTALFSSPVFPVTSAPNNCAVSSNAVSGTCLLMAANERIDAGTSAGGRAAGGAACATGIVAGGFTFVSEGVCATGDPSGDKLSGMDIYGAFIYGHSLGYHWSNSYNMMCSGCRIDNSRNLQDEDASFGLADGNVKNLDIDGGKAGKQGSGMTLAPTGTDKGCLIVHAQNLSIFDIAAGCLMSTDTNSNGGIFFVGTNANYVRATGLLQNANLYCQVPAICGIVDTGTATLSGGNVTNGGHLECGGPPPTVAGTGSTGDTIVTGNDCTGSFTVNGTGIGSSFVITFAVPMLHKPTACWGNDQTTGQLMQPVGNSINTTGVTMKLSIGTPSAGDVLSFACIGRKDF